MPTAPTAAPPRLTLPPEVRNPCALYTLPPSPTQADLDVGYATRGAQVVACDAFRELAVLTFDRDSEAAERWENARDRRRSRSCRWFRIGC